MNILIRQYLGANHSWCVVGHGFARAFKRLGHNVDLFSTDGIDHLPSDLKPNLVGYSDSTNVDFRTFRQEKRYDIGLSYTTMKNFPEFLFNCEKKFGIWCYEWAGKNAIPTGFAKYYKFVDQLLPPSEFSKKVFMDSGIPESSMSVLSHGIDPDQFKNAKSLNLSSKHFKIGVVLGQLHKRKNITALLKSYCSAFTNKDSVCLLIKASKKPTDEIDLQKLINECRTSSSPEIKVISHFIENMADFYASVDATFTMSHTEAFYFPALESLASGIVPIAPCYGGQLDFLNNNNSFLIDGKIVPADLTSMYWEHKPSQWFEPSIQDAIQKLRLAFNTFEIKNKTLSEQREDIHKKYSWDKIASTLLEMV